VDKNVKLPRIEEEEVKNVKLPRIEEEEVKNVKLPVSRRRRSKT
jgi:hypothetical protein